MSYNESKQLIGFKSGLLNCEMAGGGLRVSVLVMEQLKQIMNHILIPYIARLLYKCYNYRYNVSV